LLLAFFVISSIGFDWIQDAEITKIELHDVKQEDSKAPSDAPPKNFVPSTESISQEEEEKKPPKKAKTSAKRTNRRSASTTILSCCGVKTDVVSPGNPENDATPAVGVDASVKDKTKLQLKAANSSKKEAKKPLRTNRTPSKAGPKKNSELSNAEKRKQSCSVVGCTKFKQARNEGMCRAHYLEMKSGDDHGDDDDGGDYDVDIDIETNWRKVEPCDLVKNTRVLIAYNTNLFRATVRESPESEGGKYRIHYDGYNKSKTHLVPFPKFRALLDADDNPLEMAETPDGGHEIAYTVQVSVFSDGKATISSIEAKDTATGTASSAIDAEADLAIDLEWRQCLESLVSHQKQYGCVPSERTKAYKWFVKQTYEYSRKKTARRSSLTKNQVALLEQKAGFVFHDGSATATKKRPYDDMANDGGETANSKSLSKQTMKKVKKN
jgi:hypothetical protein